MERQVLIDHLKLAARHVAEGTRRVARQRRIAEELVERNETEDAHTAQELLLRFEELERLHEEDFARIVDRLST